MSKCKNKMKGDVVMLPHKKEGEQEDAYPVFSLEIL